MNRIRVAVEGDARGLSDLPSRFQVDRFILSLARKGFG